MSETQALLAVTVLGFYFVWSALTSVKAEIRKLTDMAEMYSRTRLAHHCGNCGVWIDKEFGRCLRCVAAEIKGKEADRLGKNEP
jgi:hypothetical protein